MINVNVPMGAPIAEALINHYKISLDCHWDDDNQGWAVDWPLPDPPTAMEIEQIVADYRPPVQATPTAAAMYALNPANAAEFGVFVWMRELAATHLAIAQARADINANLGGEAWWRANPQAAAAGLDASFAALWGACAALGITIPEGYQAIVAAWRDQFGL